MQVHSSLRNLPPADSRYTGYNSADTNQGSVFDSPVGNSVTARPALPARLSGFRGVDRAWTRIGSAKLSARVATAEPCKEGADTGIDMSVEGQGGVHLQSSSPNTKFLSVSDPVRVD